MTTRNTLSQNLKKQPILLIAILAILLSACAKGGSENTLSFISFTHASPGLPPIDVYVSGNRVNGDSIVAYNDTIPYLLVNSGILNVVVKKNISALTYISKNLEIDPASHNSFFVIGKPDSVSYLLVKDQVTLPPSGKAKLRFLNLIPNSKPLDIRITSASSLFTGIAFKSYTDFSVIDPGTYNIQIFEQGNPNPIAEKTTVIDEGRFCTVWACGLIGSADEETSPGLGLVILK